MPNSWRAGKVAVRFRPEERQGLLKSLGSDRIRFNGLGLAVVERNWHVCWLWPEELEGLNHRLTGMREPPFSASQLIQGAATVKRFKAADLQLSPKEDQPADEAGLILAAMALSKGDETFPVPWELAREAGIGSNPRLEEADIAHKLARFLRPYADQPQAGLGGLTPRKFARLISADCYADGSAFHLRMDLPPSLLQGTATLDRARLMLDAIAAWEPLPADSMGRLPMGLVLSLLENHDWPGPKRQDVWSAKGIPTEDQVPSVKLARATLQVAGLLEHRQGVFRLSRLGRSFLDQENLGGLYARLFESRLGQGAGFGTTGGEVCLRFQRALAYHLYRLATYLGNGMSFRRLVERLALPAWVYGLQPRAGAAGLAKLVSERFLEPLVEFGLLTIQQPLHNHSRDSQETYVPAPLLSRFLGFDI